MARVQKWGNSLAIRIPSHFVKTLGLENGSEVELHLVDGVFVVKPTKKKPTLEDLLAKAKGKMNPHHDYDFGDSKGKELI